MQGARLTNVLSIPNFSNGVSGVWGLYELDPPTKPKFDFPLDKGILNYFDEKG
jgi:hypothetical protein